MRATSANFDTYNGSLQKQPIYEIEFDGVTEKFTTGTFSGITGDYYKYIAELDIIPQRVDLYDFKSSFGGVDFTIIDKSDILTGLFPSTLFTGIGVTVKMGFQELAIADFVSLPKLYLTRFKFSPKTNAYQFSARDRLFQMNRAIFQNITQTNLTALAGSGLSAEAKVTHQNNAIDINESGVGNFSTTINPGSYTNGLMVSTLQAALNAAGTLTYTVSYSHSTHKFTIAATGTFTLKWATGGQANESLGEILGYDVAANDSGTTTYTADEARYYYTDARVVLDSTTGFTSPGAAPWGNSAKTYLKIDSEIMEYTSFPTGYAVVTRGQLGTTKAEHQPGAPVTEVIVVEDNPYEFLLELLETTAAGTNGNYDQGVEGFGLGIDESLVDEIQINNEAHNQFHTSDTYNNGNDEQWVITEVVANGGEWIRANILKIIPAYLFLTTNGKIGIRRWDIWGDKCGYETITTADILDRELVFLDDEVTTEVEFYREFDGGRNDWGDIKREGFDEADTAYGERERRVVRPQIYSGLTAGEYTQIRRVYSYRTANPPAQLRFRAPLKRQLYETGDLIDVTDASLPLLRDGAKGWTRETIEIVGQRITVNDGSLNVEYIGEQTLANEAADVIDIKNIPQEDMDDADLVLNATGGTTTQGDDAYVDESVFNSKLTWVRISFDPPTSPTASTEETLTFQVHVMQPAGTDVQTCTKIFKYNPNADGTQYIDIQLGTDYALTLPIASNPYRIKVDWTATSAAGADEPINMKLNLVRLHASNLTITQTDVK